MTKSPFRIKLERWKALKTELFRDSKFVVPDFTDKRWIEYNTLTGDLFKCGPLYRR